MNRLLLAAMKAYTVNSRASSTIVYRVYPPTHVHIRMIICDTVNIEHEFVRDAIPRSPVHLLGMNAGFMCCQYIKFWL
jgi:hypothetical protein